MGKKLGRELLSGQKVREPIHNKTFKVNFVSSSKTKANTTGMIVLTAKEQMDRV